MSVADEVRNAKLLYKAGAPVGALTSLLIAVAGTSRKRYPQSMCSSDGVAFKRFLHDEMVSGRFFGPDIEAAISIPWKGVPTPFEDILSGVRCSLLHEAGLGGDVVRDPTVDPKSLVLRISDEGEFVFQDTLLKNLQVCVQNAKENVGDMEPTRFSKRAPGGIKGHPEGRLVVLGDVRFPLA